MPEQEPQPGQAAPSTSRRSASVAVPAMRLPTVSKTVLRSMSLPFSRPVSMGPPDTTMEGMFSLAAAMAMPGMILSQLVTMTKASKAWPWAITSIESMMSSREGSENFMPMWFMAMPSQTPIVGNSMGRPPAA